MGYGYRNAPLTCSAPTASSASPVSAPAVSNQSNAANMNRVQPTETSTLAPSTQTFTPANATSTVACPPLTAEQLICPPGVAPTAQAPTAQGPARVNAPTAHRSGATPAPTGAPHASGGHAGWIDRSLGLNPNRTFAEAAADGLGYGPTGVFGRPARRGESDLVTAGRGLGAAAMSPLLGLGMLWGHLGDEINHGPSLLHGVFDR